MSGIHIDSTNPNRAWVSFSGFNAATLATPGHVFEVVYNPATGDGAWTDRSYDFGDIPVTDIVRDDQTETCTRRRTSACSGSRVARRAGRSPRRACRIRKWRG